MARNVKGAFPTKKPRFYIPKKFCICQYVHLLVWYSQLGMTWGLHVGGTKHLPDEGVRILTHLPRMTGKAF